ncbi:MAG: hypothetical protein HKO56_02430 [Bacteroidia bacterium]|nr:hypothetical protein [Bacteroidia bacterium]
MKLLLWIGNEPSQKALANKLAEEFDIIGIVTESRISKRKITLRKLYYYIYEKIFLSEINNAWFEMKNYFDQKYSAYPTAKRLDVENINAEEAYNFSKDLNPDLIIVSGTRLIKSTMLSIQSQKGILNLHTGVSPFIKGGPNCTNWCIATKQFHLVGNTIMWIDEGIDSGNIVTTEFTPIDWKLPLLHIHISVMEHAHRLYQKAIRFIVKGGNSNVKQESLGNGKTYYTKDWRLKNKKDLIMNLREAQKNLSQEEIQTKQDDYQTIEIKI